MTTTERVNEFQTKLRDAFTQAQTNAAAKAQEARKVLETLGDRAQAEVKTFFQQAQASSREQLGILGLELEKLGKKLREFAAQPRKPAEQPPKQVDGADGSQRPPAETVQ